MTDQDGLVRITVVDGPREGDVITVTPGQLESYRGLLMLADPRAEPPPWDVDNVHGTVPPASTRPTVRYYALYLDQKDKQVRARLSSGSTP